ncbi:MAG TPA: VWA domain-containing protein [Nitrospirota bacterium]|nr:VWA domain-containing protein [Nitrospirota bacterium]
MANELNIRCIMNKDALPVTGAEQAVYALVDIKAGGKKAFGAMPANFGLVLDRSGSMDGEKMNNLKEAVGYVVDHLGDGDLVSVTIFDDQVETLIPNQPAKNREAIKAALAKVIPRGGTQISDGLRAGLAEVKKGHSPERVNRVLLLTDGQTWDDEDACLRLAEEAGKQGVAITSIGIGEEWNEKLLLQIAEKSLGNSHWIQNPIAILDAFRQEVEGMQSVAASNLKVTARMSQGVKPVRVFSTIPMISDVSRKAVRGVNVIADLGTLDGKKGQAVLIEATAPAQKAGKFRLGQVEITYDVPSQNIRGQSIKTDMFVTFTADAAVAAKVNAEVMNLVEKVSAFKLQTRALSEAEAGNIAAATQKLQAAATVLLNLGEDDLAKAAEREILTLKKTGTLSAAGTKKLEYGTRKLTQALTEAMK